MRLFSSILLILCLAALLSSPTKAISLYDADALGQTDEQYSYEIAQANKVLELGRDEEKAGREQFCEFEILSGKKKGQEINTRNLIPDNYAYSIVVKPDKKYLIAIDNYTGEIFVDDYYRQNTVLILIAVFFIALLWLGGKQGFKSVLSLVLTALAIVYVLIPMINSGMDPVIASVLISLFCTVTTMLLVTGWSKKCAAATIGTSTGIAVSALLAILTIKLAPLSGLASDEARILLGNILYKSELHGRMLDFQGILVAGVIIGSLGAVMDVAISIASAANEIYLSNTNESRSQFFNRLLNVGRDIMGTMANTLILSYTGSAIPLFLLLSRETGLRVFNIEIIATELTAAIIGSIGLLIAIPLTALSAVYLFKRNSNLEELAELEPVHLIE